MTKMVIVFLFMIWTTCSATEVWKKFEKDDWNNWENFKPVEAKKIRYKVDVTDSIELKKTASIFFIFVYVDLLKCSDVNDKSCYIGRILLRYWPSSDKYKYRVNNIDFDIVENNGYGTFCSISGKNSLVSGDVSVDLTTANMITVTTESGSETLDITDHCGDYATDWMEHIEKVKYTSIRAKYLSGFVDNIDDLVQISYQYLDIVKYVEGTSNNNDCNDGSTKISDEDSCKRGAYSLDLKYGYKTLEPPYPAGCYISLPNKNVFFNEHKSGKAHIKSAPLCLVDQEAA